LHRSFAALPPGAQNSLKKLNERAAARADEQQAAADPGGGPLPVLDPRIDDRHAQVLSALAGVDRILSPTRFLLDSLRADGLEFDSAEVVPTGVPVDAPLQPRSSEGPLRVLFAGTWVEHKGPHILAEALRHGPMDVDARAAGPAPFPAYRDDTLDRAEGRLQSVGVLAPDAVREQMDWADVVVVPSLWAENAPLVVLEARAAGRAVLASDIGGLPELIEEGVDGQLFPAGDAGALAKLLTQSALLRSLPVRPPRSLDNFVDEVQRHYAEVLA